MDSHSEPSATPPPASPLPRGLSAVLALGKAGTGQLVRDTSRVFTSGFSKVFAFAQPHLFLQEGGTAEQLVAACKHLHRGYAPPLWARNGNVHMIGGVVLRRVYAVPRYRRQLLLLPDGGTVALDWYRNCQAVSRRFPADAPVVLVLHALTGSSHESYAVMTCSMARRKGWRSVAMNFRGSGGVRLTSPRPQSFADSADMYETVAEIRRRFPYAPLFAVGYSQGAYMVTKYVGEVDSGRLPADGKLDGAMACGSGYDYSAEIEKISRKQMIKLINYHFIITSWWKGYVKDNKAQLAKNPLIDIEAALHASTIPELEKALIVPGQGYPDLQAYYDDINGLSWIPLIRTPTLFLSAQDDPFLGETAPPRPQKECIANPDTVFVLTARGGHCAHMPLGGWLAGISWSDAVAAEFFKAILDRKAQPMAKAGTSQPPGEALAQPARPAGTEGAAANGQPPGGAAAIAQAAAPTADEAASKQPSGGSAAAVVRQWQAGAASGEGKLERSMTRMMAAEEVSSMAARQVADRK